MSLATFNEDHEEIWNVLLRIDKALVEKDAAAFPSLQHHVIKYSHCNDLRIFSNVSLPGNELV